MPMQTAQFEDRNSLMLAMLGGFGALLVYLFVVVLIINNVIEREQNRTLENAMTQLEGIILEGQVTLKSLNTYDEVACTPELLRRMRQAEFNSLYIRDIGFYQGRWLVCTTGVGPLEEPIEHVEPDYVGIDGAEFNASAEISLFDEPVVAPMSKLDRFSVVYDVRLLEMQFPEYYQFEVFRILEEGTEHTTGINGLHNALQSQGQAMFSLNHWHVACSNTFPQCVVVNLKKVDYLSDNEVMLGFALVPGLLVSLLSFGLLRLNQKVRRQLPHRLLKGLSSGAFYPVFQPIVELKSGRIIGCEILARFRDRYGEVSPIEFIAPIAALKQSIRFTNTLLTQSLSELQSQKDVLPSDFKVSLNIYAHDVSKQGLENLNFLEASAVAPFQLCIELTEQEELNMDHVSEFLAEVKDKGIEIAIDDFGTGYSNFDRIQDLQGDSAKIDRSFVMGLNSRSLNDSLIPFIVELANRHNMAVVAEGIETEEQRELLVSLGIAYGQGYYFGRPMSAVDLFQMIRQQAP